MADDLSTTEYGKHGHGKKGTGNDANAVFAGENALVNQRVIQLSFYHVATRKCVYFNGMVTGFSDNFASSWASETVYGRMDPIMTFQNTQRNISLSWVVPSVSEDHARINLHKFEHLSSLLYPTYKTKRMNMQGESSPLMINTMEAAPLIKVKFTNLIHGAASGAPSARAAAEAGLLCAVGGFNFNPNLDMGFFNPEPGIIYPKEYSVDCQMTVLHEHELGWAKGRNSKDKDRYGWMAQNDKFPYGVDKLTGGLSLCGGKGSPPVKPAKAPSQTNKNIGKALQNNLLKGIGRV